MKTCLFQLDLSPEDHYIVLWLSSLYGIFPVGSRKEYDNGDAVWFLCSEPETMSLIQQELGAFNQGNKKAWIISCPFEAGTTLWGNDILARIRSAIGGNSVKGPPQYAVCFASKEVKLSFSKHVKRLAKLFTCFSSVEMRAVGRIIEACRKENMNTSPCSLLNSIGWLKYRQMVDRPSKVGKWAKAMTKKTVDNAGDGTIIVRE